MIEISDNLQKNIFYIAIFGYIGIIIVILIYYFNLNFTWLNLITTIFSFMIFPVFFIMIMSQNIKSSHLVRKDMEQMDIDTYLKSYSNYFSNKPSWLLFGLSFTLIYSFISFFYWMAHSSGGVPVIEHGEYFVRNHTIVHAITREKYEKLIRFEHMGTLAHLLSFYAISIWMLYKKEYI